MNKEKFEVIIPERIFIVNNLEDVKDIMKRYNCRGITVRRTHSENP